MKRVAVAEISETSNISAGIGIRGGSTKSITLIICIVSLFSLIMVQVPNTEPVCTYENDGAGTRAYFTTNMVLETASFSFSPETGAAGQLTTISVDIINNGPDVAVNVIVDFYIKEADGTDIHMSQWSTSVVQPYETATASITWTPEFRGEYTMWARVSTPSEDLAYLDDNDNLGSWYYSTYSVEGAAWVLPAIMMVVIGTVIMVFFTTRLLMKSAAALDPDQSPEDGVGEEEEVSFDYIEDVEELEELEGDG